MITLRAPLRKWLAPRRIGGLGATLIAIGISTLATPMAVAAEDVPGSMSDVRVTDTDITATLVLRADQPLVIDPSTIKATVGGKPASVTSTPAGRLPRSTMLVIDTSGSMGASGMATVRAAVKDFLAAVPKDVKVGVVSFASTAGMDVAPTTNYAKVSKEVASLRSDGETALYDAVQIAVKGLGTDGERSIILLSDGGDTIAQRGGDGRAAAELNAAISALTNAKVRAEVVSFKSAEGNAAVLKKFAAAGGGSVANAADSTAVSGAFQAAARALASQSVVKIVRPAGVQGLQPIVVEGVASGRPFSLSVKSDMGDTAPVVTPSTGPTLYAQAPVTELSPLTAAAPKLLYPAVGVIALGVFVIVASLAAPTFRSRRSQRVQAIEAYGFGRTSRGQAQRQAVSASAISEQLVQMGERVMEGRESTTKTMALLDRADLPWRAGEWLVLRFIAVLVASAVGFLLFGSHPVVGLVIGLIAGIALPPLVLRFLARRRSKRFEALLPDVLMLVATSLSSGFSLLQALDAVARDATEPAAKEFSRALAEARIGADVSDALEHMAVRMESENMRWAVMAIRIQREVGGNLAETLRTTAATLREREMLRRQVRALSAEGRLSAYILIGLPIGLLFYTMWVNYEYVSLLWTTFLGIIMSIVGIIAMIIGIFWMRNVVKIEV